ncbi:MAG: fused response regulator/phosphatase [Magnetococcales bacterium]|nr:fused response regulator/phosphatase [Magnetococcales bacterium]
MSSILIVEDDPVTRIFLEALLLQEGHQVFLAVNGAEALALLQVRSCDLVLMDILMPEMDGYEATRRIKAQSRHGLFIPVIFLTSVQTDQELAQCLACGGDDFLNKPPSPILLNARVRVWLQRAELTNRLAIDRADVENVILRMRQDAQFDPHGLRVLMTPLGKATGDIVLSARRPDGVQYLMVGDFAGHGLAAAICGPLVSDLFYRLTRQDVPLHEVIGQMNTLICDRLPINMFLSAAFLELDRTNGAIHLWNAAFPPVVRIRDGKVVDRCAANLPLLGILPSLDIPRQAWGRRWQAGDRGYLYSDGSVETRSEAGEFFGVERLEAFMEKELFPGGELESLLTLLTGFRGKRSWSDDITIVEIS